MKKLIILMTILFALAVFVSGYTAEIDRQSLLSDGPDCEMQTENPQLQRKGYMLSLPADEWGRMAVPALERIARDQQTIFVVHYGRPSRDMREETELYLILPEGVRYPAYTAAGIPINQETLEKFWFTTDRERSLMENAVLLDATSPSKQAAPERIVTLISMKNIHPSEDYQPYWMEVIGEKLNVTAQQLREVFPEGSLEENELGESLRLTRELQPAFLRETVIVFWVGLIIMAMCWFFENKREIMIRKLLGQKPSVIFAQLFLPLLLASAVLLAVVLSGVYLVVVRNFRPVNFRLIDYLVKQMLLFFCGLSVSGGVIWTATAGLSVLESMKESRGESRFSSTGFLVKAACIMLSLTAMTANLYMVSSGTMNLVGLMDKEVREFVTGRIALNWLAYDRSSNPLAQPESIRIEELESEIPMLFQDIYPEKDAFYYAALERPVQNFACNVNYLEKYPVFDTAGNILHLEEGKRYLLIPESIQYRENTSAVKADGGEVIQIQSGQITHSLSAWNFEEQLVMHDPVIEVTDKWNPFQSIGFASGMSHYYEPDETHTLEDIEALLVGQNFQKLSWLKTSDSYVTKVRILQKDVMKHAGTLSVLLSIFIVMMYYTTRLFLIDEKNKAAIQALLGRSWLDRYGLLVLFNALVYLGCGLLGVFCLQTDPMMTAWMMGGFFLLDLGISEMLIHRFETKKLAGCLKGDEI